MTDQVQEANESLARNTGGDAVLAMKLIEYQPQLEKALRFVFGNTMVVSSSQVGQAIANQKDTHLRRKCVNLEGDTFDITGSLSGGYVNH